VLKFVFLVAVFAAVTYLVARWIEQRNASPAPRRRTTPPARPVGPDDDPEFLRELDRRRRHPEDPET
jgi:hypothetical protein